MADFKQALNEGFEAAKKAELARREILDVLATLKKDLLGATNGKLIVETTKFTVPVVKSRWQSVLESTTAGIAGLGIPEVPRIRTYIALGARKANTDTAPTIELAEWETGANGYPCTLRWNDQERQCTDRIALENCLVDLLKDPRVGEKIERLLQ